MKRTHTIIGVLSSSLVLLAILAFAPMQLNNQVPTEATWHATWRNHPTSLREAKRLAQAIVTARVVTVSQGPDIVVAARGEPNGEDRLATQRVTFEVVKAHMGKVERTFTLFRTGTDTKYIEGDRPYHVGETHLLFIAPKANEAGTYLVIAPEGRYQVLSGKLVPESSEGFAAALRGKSVAEVEQALVREK